jgi:L-fuconolactonase
VIDSHHHLWRYSARDYPWIPPGSRLAHDHGLAELDAATTAASVTGTVVVQARQALEESAWLLDLGGQSELIRGVVGWVPLVAPEVGGDLERLAANPKFKAVRHVLQEEPDEYFLRDDFHRGLAQLPAFGLAYDLLIYQRQLPLGMQLVDRHPNLAVVVDHLAKPEIHNGRVEPAWRAAMAELAKRPNVIGVKISGLATEVTDAAVDEPTLRAYFDEALAIFGPERLMFGTDWPVCLLRLESYTAWADMVRRFVAPLSAAEQELVLTTNCARAYRL